MRAAADVRGLGKETGLKSVVHCGYDLKRQVRSTIECTVSVWPNVEFATVLLNFFGECDWLVVVNMNPLG